MTTILIEDDIKWRAKLQVQLDELNITILGVATTVTEAILLLEKHKPDFITADILLDKELVFDVFKHSLQYCDIPTIFITTSDKEVHFKEANKIKKHLYVVKPIHKLTLKSAIENLCIEPKSLADIKTNAFILKGTYNEKVEIPFDKIIYAVQSLNYCTIHTQHKSFTLKKSLRVVMRDLDNRFLRVHASYCINTNYIESFGISLSSVTLKNINFAIPLGVSYITDIKKYIVQQKRNLL